MRIAKFRTIGLLSACATLTVAGAAFAQAPAPAPAPAAPATPEPAPAAAPAPAAPAPAAQAQVGMALPGAAPAADPGGSDHDGVVGHLAIGYLGRPGMVMAAPPAAAAPNTQAVAAPIIGIRYWIDPMIGIDAGIGLSITSNSVTPPAPAPKVDNFAPTVFMLHGGVPLALANAKHFSFQIIPEFNFGTASGSVTPPPDAMGAPTGPKVTYSGTHFDIGARAGAEIQFGFINIPQLSLQAGVGLAFSTDSQKVESDAFTPAGGATQPGATAKSSQSSLATSVGDNPWNIFTSNIAALYYF